MIKNLFYRSDHARLFAKRSQFLFFLAFVVIAVSNISWGFWAHKKINQWAVGTLPGNLKSFYSAHIDSITERAIAPDLRRRTDKSEGARHYIDADHYGSFPFDSIPHQWQMAVKKYSADTLIKYGINPWHINSMMLRLTNAFRQKNTDSIIFLSADLGHYVADAHVPLHTTTNYDGQLSGQKGIHALWEARIVELDSSKYRFPEMKAVYLKDPLEKSWSILRDSYNCVDSVLAFDRQVKKEIPADKWYTTSIVDGREQKTFSEAYALRYDQLLNDMITRRMQSSVIDVGSFWYTAWVNAGKPDLRTLK